MATASAPAPTPALPNLSSVAELMQQELTRIEGLRQAALAIGQAGSLQNAVKELSTQHAELTAKVATATKALADATAKAQAVEAQAATHLNAAHIAAAAATARATNEAAATVAEGKRQALDLTNQARAALEAKLAARQKVLDATNAQVVAAEAQLAKHQADAQAAQAELAKHQAQLAAAKAAVATIAGTATVAVQSGVATKS